jgi:hypothetical protein
VSIFKKVSLEDFDEIREVIIRFIESRGRRNIFRLRSLDEDEEIKRIIELFERNSTIKGSVGNVLIYVISIYCHDPRSRSGEVFIVPLIVERSSSGYTVKIGYGGFDSFSASSEEEVAERVRKKIGSFMRLIEKALSTKHPLTTKLAELIDCLDGVRTVDLLYRIYGDEILDDTETISGIYRACSWETRFFANDKVIVIPSISLWVVRDIRNNKIFRNYASQFAEVSSEEKIFYDALFIGSRDLLEPEAVVKSYLSYEYVFSSSETTVDGKEISLVAVGWYDPRKKSWNFLEDVFAITCGESAGDKCLIYSFKKKYFLDNKDEIEDHDIPRYILGSRRIREETKRRVAEDRVKRHTWEVLPA